MKKQYIKPESAAMLIECNTILSGSQHLEQGDPKEQASDWDDKPDGNNRLWAE